MEGQSLVHERSRVVRGDNDIFMAIISFYFSFRRALNVYKGRSREKDIEYFFRKNSVLTEIFFFNRFPHELDVDSGWDQSLNLAFQEVFEFLARIQ